MSGTWSGGASGAGSCLTDAPGRCPVGKGSGRKVATATFTVDTVSHPDLGYAPVDDHAPMSITLSRP